VFLTDLSLDDNKANGGKMWILNGLGRLENLGVLDDCEKLIQVRMVYEALKYGGG
jgi:hypothetical protein